MIFLFLHNQKPIFMKNLKKFLLLLFTVIIVAVIFNYPKLNILAGYSAKSTASSVFLAKRTLELTDTTDNNFSPINLASDAVNNDEKSSTSSAFGLLTRKAFYREGLGTVLALDNEDLNKTYLAPNRAEVDNKTPFPYGSAEQKDTVFNNIDYDKLNKTIEFLFDSVNQTRAAVVVYKNQIIAEKYANGFDKHSKLLGWSMTKSVVSTLYGVLAYQNKLDVNKKALFDEWKNDERKEISIHNLLQMNSGLDWLEDYNTISDVTKMLFLERDMTKIQVAKSLVGKPNESWNYSSGTTNLLSGILRNHFSNHQEYLDFWYTDLIDKIGMNSMTVEADLAGNYVGSSYGWATARDWSKLGLLYLNNGNWNGEQLFSKEWVKYATNPTPTSNGQYGAQIWLNAGKTYPNAPTSMYSFNGYQGQYVFILPEQDLVIVRMGLTKNADLDALISGIIKSIN